MYIKNSYPKEDSVLYPVTDNWMSETADCMHY